MKIAALLCALLALMQAEARASNGAPEAASDQRSRDRIAHAIAWVHGVGAHFYYPHPDANQTIFQPSDQHRVSKWASRKGARATDSYVQVTFANRGTIEAWGDFDRVNDRYVPRLARFEPARLPDWSGNAVGTVGHTGSGESRTQLLVRSMRILAHQFGGSNVASSANVAPIRSASDVAAHVRLPGGQKSLCVTGQFDERDGFTFFEPGVAWVAPTRKVNRGLVAAYEPHFLTLLEYAPTWPAAQLAALRLGMNYLNPRTCSIHDAIRDMGWVDRFIASDVDRDVLTTFRRVQAAYALVAPEQAHTLGHNTLSISGRHRATWIDALSTLSGP